MEIFQISVLQRFYHRIILHFFNSFLLLTVLITHLCSSCFYTHIVT